MDNICDILYCTKSDEVVALLNKKEQIKPNIITETRGVKSYNYNCSRKLVDIIKVLYSEPTHKDKVTLKHSFIKRKPLFGFFTIADEIVTFLKDYDISPIYKYKKRGIWVYCYENSQKLFMVLTYFYPEID